MVVTVKVWGKNWLKQVLMNLGTFWFLYGSLILVVFSFQCWDTVLLLAIWVCELQDGTLMLENVWTLSVKLLFMYLTRELHFGSWTWIGSPYGSLAIFSLVKFYEISKLVFFSNFVGTYCELISFSKIFFVMHLSNDALPAELKVCWHPCLRGNASVSGLFPRTQISISIYCTSVSLFLKDSKRNANSWLFVSSADSRGSRDWL